MKWVKTRDPFREKQPRLVATINRGDIAMPTLHFRASLKSISKFVALGIYIGKGAEFSPPLEAASGCYI